VKFFFSRVRTKGLKVPSLKGTWWKLGLFVAVMGPGIITGNVDNDIGGIATYSSAGASYGFKLLWILLLSTFSLAIVQEMTARLGTITGKGLGALIRENFGFRITFYVLLALLLTNFANTISEFAGIAAGTEIFGISRFWSVPIAALFIWFFSTRGNYRTIEKLLLIFCLFYVAYIFAGFLAKPVWSDVITSTLIPSFDLKDIGLVTMTITIIGTTIAPWMQFYQQSTVAEKHILIKQYKYEKLDTYLGSFLTNFVAFFIIVATGATLYKNGIRVTEASDAARALVPFAGKFASSLFAIGLINAGVMAGFVLPISTAYSISEGFGWQNGMGKKFKEAPRFYALFTILVFVSALVILFTKLNLIKVMLFSQTLNGILLPVILFFMLKLINDESIMGSHINTKYQNFVTIITIVSVSFLTILMLLLTFWPAIKVFIL